ncbi:unnamed protein product [Staurois parvus]|uniref:Uncharacterized protein n=1 Tax=Staurois parvus TaxID=386267 RepID=A0ABN9EFS1_9NEOB|nr:unnamed protein product [Staurois parvus]
MFLMKTLEIPKSPMSHRIEYPPPQKTINLESLIAKPQKSLLSQQKRIKVTPEPKKRVKRNLCF